MRTRTAGCADILAPWPALGPSASTQSLAHLLDCRHAHYGLQETTCDQEFPVARGPEQGRRRGPQHGEAQTPQRALDVLHDAFVHRGIAHHPTLAHRLAAGLELRLD